MQFIFSTLQTPWRQFRPPKKIPRKTAKNRSKKRRAKRVAFFWFKKPRSKSNRALNDPKWKATQIFFARPLNKKRSPRHSEKHVDWKIWKLEKKTKFSNFFRFWNFSKFFTNSNYWYDGHERRSFWENKKFDGGQGKKC